MASSFKIWLSAARPRTLLLALASIAMGIFLAASRGQADALVGVFCVLTAACLQILSNLANDYGDARHGLDNDARLGPKRAVQSGLVSALAMRNAMIAMAVLSVLSGVTLILLAFGPAKLLLSLVFVVLGGAAIWAAIAYTATDKPYGYVGLGDLMVFVFFGLVAVLGSFFLQSSILSWDLVLPATALGFLSVAVLNVNNVRDLESDKAAGKQSLAVRLGARNARLYHVALLLGSILCSIIYIALNYESLWQFLFILALPFMVFNGVQLWQRQQASEIDPLLKQMSITTLLYTLFFGLGQLF